MDSCSLERQNEEPSTDVEGGPFDQALEHAIPTADEVPPSPRSDTMLSAAMVGMRFYLVKAPSPGQSEQLSVVCPV